MTLMQIRKKKVKDAYQTKGVCKRCLRAMNVLLVESEPTFRNWNGRT